PEPRGRPPGCATASRSSCRSGSARHRRSRLGYPTEALTSLYRSRKDAGVLRKNAKLELLKKVPLFSLCSKKELEEVAQLADEVDLPTGRNLATEGATGKEFVVIIEGSADVRRKGRKINTLGAGDFLGEIA